MRKILIRVGAGETKTFYATTVAVAVKRATERMSLRAGDQVEITVMDKGTHTHDYLPTDQKRRDGTVRHIGHIKIDEDGRERGVAVEHVITSTVTKCRCGRAGKPVNAVMSSMPTVSAPSDGRCGECDQFARHTIMCSKLPVAAELVRKFIADYEAGGEA